MSYTENTKVNKSDNTKRAFKEKGVYETSEMTPQHAYLGQARSSLDKGHIPEGKIARHTMGTSKLLHDDAGVPNKAGTDEKY